MKTPLQILPPHAQEYVVVIKTKYQGPQDWADCIDGLIRVVQHTDKMYIIAVGAIVTLVRLVWVNATSDRIDIIWLLNTTVELEINSTVY